MTIAALALALAVMVNPAQPRLRLPTSRLPSPVGSRFRLLYFAVLAPVALVLVLPAGAAAATAFACGTAVLRHRRGARRRQRGDEVAALNAALEILAGELRAGAHPATAMEAAACEVISSVARPLRAVAARARLGADVAAGLRSVAADSGAATCWERLAVVWQLAQTHGLTMATLMAAAHRDIAERQRFSVSVTASMAGARTTAAILAGLPLIGVGLGQLIGADPVRFLFSSGAGGWFLAAGVALGCGGLLWSDRLIDAVAT